jgi:hypothetical protein
MRGTVVESRTPGFGSPALQLPPVAAACAHRGEEQIEVEAKLSGRTPLEVAG